MIGVRLSSTFKTFLALLNERDVEYLVVGGFAVQYHGYLRATHDLDIWTATDRENAARLSGVLQAFGAGVTIESDVFTHPNRIVAIEVPPLAVDVLQPEMGRRPDVVAQYTSARPERIEILTIQSGKTFEACFPARVIDTLDGVKANIVSLEHLKQIKRASGRPGDLDDAVRLPRS